VFFTPWGREVEKPVVSQLFNKFLAFYGTRELSTLTLIKKTFFPFEAEARLNDI
jgi:hypothetical protein